MALSIPRGTLVLAESAELAEFARFLYDLTGLRMAFYAPDGVSSRGFDFPVEDEPLCGLIRRAPDGQSRCAACNREHFERAARRHRELSYACHAGLTDFAVPIHAGGRHIGTISCGQILPEPPSEAGLRRLLQRNADLKLDPAAARAAYFKSLYLPPGKIAAVMRLFAFFAQHLCRVTLRLQRLERRGEQPDIARAKRYIATHLRRADLGLAEVAGHVGLSPGYFSHLFHKTAGVRFTRFVQAVRIREARTLLRKTALPITQIAFDCGFQNPTHFNRVFRAFVGCAPSRYRNR